MVIYKPLKGMSSFYMIFLALLTNIFVGVLIYLVDSYVVVSLFRVTLSVMNVYFLYYVLLSISLSYSVDDSNVVISQFWGVRKIKIPFADMEGYEIHEGKIRGVKLSGVGNDKFAFGRTVIDKIGTTHMFVTSSEKIIYIKTAAISYALSVKETDEIKDLLKVRGIKDSIEEYKLNKNVDIYKESAFLLPFIIVTIIIIVLTLNPFILYLKNMLPSKMPLNFDQMFMPIQYGSGKQFAFKQMTYGVLNMVILLCMYYASYFCAKYDRKTAYRYIYVAMATALTFLLVQVRILVTFR
jgi:hypothetical protein